MRVQTNKKHCTYLDEIESLNKHQRNEKSTNV